MNDVELVLENANALRLASRKRGYEELGLAADRCMRELLDKAARELRSEEPRR